MVTRLEKQLDYDWRVETRLRGTVSRVGVYVRQDCARCDRRDVLVYQVDDQEDLWCAECVRWWASDPDHRRQQACDECGRAGHVLRDPLTRENLYLCVHCRLEAGLAVPVNRWATAPRESAPLGLREGAVCAAAGHGTECRGEIKWRGQFKMSLCNKHAGKQGVGPNG